MLVDASPLTLATLALASSLLVGCDNSAKPEPQTPSSGPRPSSSTAADGAPTSSGSSSAPTASGTPLPKPTPAEARGFAEASNAFAFDLHNRLAKPTGNLLYSPASLSTALAMTWGGAVGTTADEMRKVLHFAEPMDDVLGSVGRLSADLQREEKGPVLAIANRLFGEKTFSFQAPFLSRTHRLFGAPLEPVDYRGDAEGVRKHINGWVKERTRDRIDELIPQRAIDDETRLTLVNAVYFLGDWEEPFSKDATTDLPFAVQGKAPKPVPTMRRTGSFRSGDVEGTRLIELPYEGGRFALLVAVPAKPDGLPALEASLDLARYGRWVSALAPERIFLSLPRFEIDPPASTPLKEVLVDLGMKLAFDRDHADFTGIADPPSPADRLVVGNVFHKAFVRVDEKGTEAAAATAVVMPRAGGAPQQPKELAVDRPFLFFLRDVESGLILFAGRVDDPTQKG